jgi:hypothetical protein
MLGRLVSRLLVVLVTSAIGKGIVKGIVKAFALDDKVARMISQTRAKAPAGLGWIMAGTFGLLCLVGWEFFHVDTLLLRLKVWAWDEAGWPSSSPYHWEPLSTTEASELRAELTNFQPQPIAILCAHDDCGDLARSLRDAFHQKGWSPDIPSMTFVQPKDGTGIEIAASDDTLWQIAEIIERATHGRLTVARREGAFPFNTDYCHVAIIIGSKS